MDRGYPGESAVRFVSDHRRLPEEERFILQRTIVPANRALARMAKCIQRQDLRDKVVFVDGYNTIITTHSLLAGYPVYLCDDGFLRDTRAFFRSGRELHVAASALSEVLDLLASARPSRVQVLFDQQISRSGEMAGGARRMMTERGLLGEAECARDVDHLLKACGSIVASSDGNIIDAAAAAIDIPGEIARRHCIRPLLI